MKDRGIRVGVLDPESPLLGEVISLGDRNARFLGHFPNSCYAREARQELILVAVDSSSALMGYILFRVARNRAVIQHLCVHEDHRGAGVARALVDCLKGRTRHLDGIVLHCAREFPSHELWPKLGFIPVGEKPGRGQVIRQLTRFWFDHGHPGLFTSRADDERSARIAVVIDANVVYSLQDDDDPECSALKADYLQEEIDLCITPELYHEINRHDDAVNRDRRRGFAHGLRQLDAPRELVEEHLVHLNSLVSHPQSHSGQSDLQHLATAIANGARIFVTKDGRLLGHAELIGKHFGLRVVQPAALIAQIDESHRADTYSPSLLKGSAVHIRRVGSMDFQTVSEHFLATGSGERRSSFLRQLGELCSTPHNVEPLLFEHPRGTPLALSILDLRDTNIATVAMSRVRPGRLATTMAHFIATHAIRTAVSRGRSEVIVADPTPLFSLESALDALGFSFDGACWRRRLEYGCPQNGTPPYDEHMRWPAKFLDVGIESFVVPIKPHYFRDLIGTEVFENDPGMLFGGDPRLILSPESVYYRSPRPAVVEAPGRILWYESKGKRDGRQALVACSVVRGVEIGPVKQVYDRFHRFGVLDWQQVSKIAHTHPDGHIMAIRYGLTEHFRHPVPLKAVQRRLIHHLGHSYPFSTATRIPEACFAEFYRAGMGLAIATNA